MVKEGYYFGLPLLALGLIGLVLYGYGPIGPGLGAILILLGAFVFYFFRNPPRNIPQEPGLVVSPADGRVLIVKDEDYLGRPGKRISIFLAVWNVHVNRSPAAGKITRMEYRPGKFFAAMKVKASAENEQNVFSLQTPNGEMIFKQIAGLIARRVVSWKNPGDVVERGELIGLVRFGSRADVWLPREAQIVVAVGDHVKGGSSVIARWSGGKAESLEAEEELALAGSRSL